MHSEGMQAGFFLQNCEGHPTLLSIYLTQQLHPTFHHHAPIMFLVLPLTTGIEDATTTTIIFYTVHTLGAIPSFLCHPVRHSDPQVGLPCVDMAAEGEGPFPDHHIEQHHLTFIITPTFGDGVVVDGEELGIGSSHHIYCTSLFHLPFLFSLLFLFLPLFCH